MQVVGKVTSVKMNQTVVVQVDQLVSHLKYHKRLRQSCKFYAHVTGPVKVGDTVHIRQVRPISKTKTWQVEEKL